MNWYKMIKHASVTFSLEGSDRIAQPMHLLDLSYDLGRFIWYTLKKPELFGGRTTSDTIAPDGTSQYNGPIGIINFYVQSQQIPTDSIKEAINAWIEDKAITGYKISCGNPEKSGSRNALVFRINVIENPSSEYPQIPEMNLANSNYYAFAQFLGLIAPFQEDYAGSMSLQELKQKLNQIDWNNTETFRPPLDTHTLEIPEDATPQERADIIREQAKNRQRARWIDYGLSRSDMMWYVQEMTKLVDFGLKNGFTEISWG